MTFRSCGLSPLSMEVSLIDRCQSLSYWVSEGVVNSLTQRNFKTLGRRLPTSGCYCSSDAAEIFVCRCSAIVAV